MGREARRQTSLVQATTIDGREECVGDSRQSVIRKRLRVEAKSELMTGEEKGNEVERYGSSSMRFNCSA